MQNKRGTMYGILQMRIKVYLSNNNVYSRDNMYVVKSEVLFMFLE